VTRLIPLILFLSFFIKGNLAAGFFLAGKPAWPAGREKEKNLTAGFRAEFKVPNSGKVVLRLTASSLYRFYLNGNFQGYGPARGPHGYYRVDEWDLSGSLEPGVNVLAVEACGYNINSYYLLDQPSFLQAEIVSGNEVLAATGVERSSFAAYILKERVRKVQRYSFQRTFTEIYSLKPGFDNWRKVCPAPQGAAACSVFPEKRLLQRRVPYPEFHLRQPVRDVSSGKIKTGVEPEEIWKDRSLTQIGPDLGGFRERELETIPSIELQKTAAIKERDIDQPLEGPVKINLAANSYHIVDLGTNLTGFVGAKVTARKNTRLFVVFDEILSNGDVDFKRLNCVNIISYEIEPGEYEIESIEPYTMRYLKFIVLKGECGIENIHLREYVNPEAQRAFFAAADQRLDTLFAAARETFRQNALDIFMDCPSRERAGWLCDSYFTARAAVDLCGNTLVENNFLENYLLPDSFAYLPKGMLPMCYPADHNRGIFIPNWALWFVLELEEYFNRSGDRNMLEAARPRVMQLFDYFRKFRNGDGLLEKLESWIFIEWSEANDFVQDVNYPTNMLYAAALEAAGRMYNLPLFIAEAEKVREVIRRQSFDGDFFVDNAIRKLGKLTPTRNRSEVCQYYAFFLKTATQESYPELWRVLKERFTPKRKLTGAYPEIFQSRPFIGNVLRLEVLSQAGFSGQVLEESIDYYLGMAERTGTLWEFEGARASCNHGFGSHVAHVLFRDVLGIYQVDIVKKEVKLRFSSLELNWCEGRLPISEGEIYLKWWKEGENIAFRISVPSGFRVSIENLSGKEIVSRP
jgi:alpha-L-rhamnosidase